MRSQLSSYAENFGANNLDLAISLSLSVRLRPLRYDTKRRIYNI